MDQLINSIGAEFFKSVGILIIIGTLVSLDVRCLILSQYRDFAIGQNNPPAKLKSPRQQARLHARFHALLFLLYMALATFLAWAYKEVMETISSYAIWLANTIISFLPFSIELILDQEALSKSLVMTIGIAIIIFTWITYGEKIVEDYRSNIEDPINSLKRIDVRIIYWFLKSKTQSFEKATDYALALAVAVDMLAISAVIRVYFEGTLDSGYTGFHIDFLNFPVFANLPESLRWLINVLIFTIGIYGIVLFWTQRTAKRSSTLLSDNPEFRIFGFSMAWLNVYLDSKIKDKNINGSIKCRLIAYRLLEPFVVFFVLAGAIFHLVASPSDQNIPLFEFLIWQTSLAFWLWICLISLHGPTKIFQKIDLGVGCSTLPPDNEPLNKEPESTQEDDIPPKPSHAWHKYLLVAVKACWHLIIAFLFYGGLLICFFASHNIGGKDPFIAFTNNLSIYLGVWATLVLYAPLFFPDLEARFELRYFSNLESESSLSPKSDQRFQLATLLAALGIPAYLHVTFSYPNSFFTLSTEPFILGIFLLVLLFGAASILTWYRGFRNRRLCLLTEHRVAFNQYRTSFSDYLTSWGIVCLWWQLLPLLNQWSKS